MKNIKLYLFLLILSSFNLLADKNIPDITLTLSYQTVEIGDKNLIAVNFNNHPHWHTYWKNPGDAGLPLNISFSHNGQKLKIESLEWPIPAKYIEEGNLEAFGYEGSYTLFFPFPDHLTGKKFDFHAKWLICKHICIPGEKKFQGQFDKTFTMGNTLKKDELKKRYQNLPKEVPFPHDLDLILSKTKKENELILYANLSPREKIHRNINLLTPFPHKLLTFKHESIYKDKKNVHYTKTIIEWDGEYLDPPQTLPKDGIFKAPLVLKFLFANPHNGKVEIINKTFTHFSLEENKTTEKFFSLLKKVDNQDIKAIKKAKGGEEVIKKIESPNSNPSSNLIYFLIFAFIGGLILNVMPCVLPVISIKLFGLLQIRDEAPTRILKHNIAYTLGVLATFAILGAIVLIIQTTGESIGWGFQLQSPKFVAIMIILLFVFALNLFGLFEFSTPGGRTLGNLNPKSGLLGDFLGGVLATILSTPCSAPFLGTALTFAFSTSGATLFLIFFFIGLGLSFPFIITGIFPSLIKFLPKPGNWMEHIKKLLGLTLMLTIIWLMDVFIAQVDSSLWHIKLNTLLLMLFFAFYAAKYITSALAIRFVLFLLPTLFFTHIMVSPLQHFSDGKASTALLKDKTSLGLNWEAWSTTKMEKYKNSGDLVFMDFTAKWCFTCKVNEKLVLDTPAFSNIVQKHKIKLLLGDWTKRDPIIGDWLKSHGLVGVPAYFIQKKNGELISLGETISIDEIEKNL